MSRNVIVDIAGAAISDAPDGAGHLLARLLPRVVFYDTVLHVGGMAHCMLPLSQLDAHKAEERPFMFVDVGVPRLLEELFKRGCRKKDLITRVAGVSRVMDNNNLFRNRRAQLRRVPQDSCGKMAC